MGLWLGSGWHLTGIGTGIGLEFTGIRLKSDLNATLVSSNSALTHATATSGKGILRIFLCNKKIICKTDLAHSTIKKALAKLICIFTHLTCFDHVCGCFDFRAQMRFLIIPPPFSPPTFTAAEPGSLLDTPTAQRDHTVAVARGFNRHPCANVRIALSAGDRGHVYWGSRQVRRSPPHQTLEPVVMQCTLVCMQG